MTHTASPRKLSKFHFALAMLLPVYPLITALLYLVLPLTEGWTTWQQHGGHRADHGVRHRLRRLALRAEAVRRLHPARGMKKPGSFDPGFLAFRRCRGAQAAGWRVLRR
jgi:hypothetical protein